jgi:hypothetical protein
MNPLLFHFVPDRETLLSHSLSLKQRRCPRCQCARSLNRHSFLYGNDPAIADARMLRGQRVFCCNRGRRGGCGKTFSIFLADVLPRHSVTAAILWGLLCLLLAGRSLKAAVDSLHTPFALETFYHLVDRLRGRLDVLRPLLFTRGQPPPCSNADPLSQTAAHLQAVLQDSACPLRDFQCAFQRPLCG